MPNAENAFRGPSQRAGQDMKRALGFCVISGAGARRLRRFALARPNNVAEARSARTLRTAKRPQGRAPVATARSSSAIPQSFGGIQSAVAAALCGRTPKPAEPLDEVAWLLDGSHALASSNALHTATLRHSRVQLSDPMRYGASGFGLASGFELRISDLN